MQVKYYKPTDRSSWQAYIARAPQATIFHTLGWKKAVEQTFKLQAHYLYAQEGDRICGILPLFLNKGWLLGASLISVPFGVYGGICAEDEQAEALLLEEAKAIAKQEEVGYIEFRNLRPAGGNLPTKDLYMTFILELPDDAEVVWKTMRKRNRNILRKGIKSGLQLYRSPEPGRIEEEEFTKFYDLFARTQRALGTPVLPKTFFKNLAVEFDSQISLFSAVHEGKIISSLWVFFFKDTVLPYYIGYDHRYLAYAPNNWILWEAIKYSCEHGYRYYDLGRSRQDSGSFRFKKHWGIEPRPLYYQYYLNTSPRIPNISPSNPKFDLPKRIWSHLPFGLTKALGPKLVKYLG
jgi:FemAB-related protein (PEP-CTERM system-associated)